MAKRTYAALGLVAVGLLLAIALPPSDATFGTSSISKKFSIVFQGCNWHRFNTDHTYRDGFMDTFKDSVACYAPFKSWGITKFQVAVAYKPYYAWYWWWSPLGVVFDISVNNWSSSCTDAIANNVVVQAKLNLYSWLPSSKCSPWGVSRYWWA